MKKYLFLLLFCSTISSGFCQNNDKLIDFSKKSLEINKAGMITLGSWAVVNIATNAILQQNATGETKAFEQMNVYWNVFNLGVAGLGYFTSKRANSTTSPYSTLNQQNNLEKVFLINTGLDAAYVVGGFWLIEKGKNSPTQAETDKLSGYGKSVILQGAFLLLFDLTMYGIHHHHLKSNEKIFENLQLSSNGIGLSYRF